MLLLLIIFLTILLVVYRMLSGMRGLNRMLLIVSLITIYWFQPISTIRTLDFWLPTFLIGISLIVWSYIRDQKTIFEKETIVTFTIILLIILLIGLSRYVDNGLIENFVSVPVLPQILVFIVVILILIFMIIKYEQVSQILKFLIIFLILSILIILKYEPATESVSIFLRKVNRQSINLASAAEISWIGFSYFAFRLLHVLYEKNRLRKLQVSLNDFFVYLIFFPTFTAGPIARLDQFVNELNKIEQSTRKNDFLEGGIRIGRGLFFKFIIADSLAVISIESIPVNQVKGLFWLWLMVYAFAFRIYLDFAGYTDIAIGLSKLVGIKIPENFNKPYLSENITVFWNRWHITLTQWFRTYYFNPIIRYFRINYQKFPPFLLIFFGQLSTMVLIGLWHGINLNFVVWGIWNGIGLFLHNRWTEKIDPKLKKSSVIHISKVGKICSVILTFNYIALGWIWFATPNISNAILIIQKMFGLP